MAKLLDLIPSMQGMKREKSILILSIRQSKRYYLYCLKEWEKLQAKLDQEKKEEVLS